MEMAFASLTQRAVAIKPVGIFELCPSQVTRNGRIYIRHDDLGRVG